MFANTFNMRFQVRVAWKNNHAVKILLRGPHTFSLVYCTNVVQVKKLGNRHVYLFL